MTERAAGTVEVGLAPLVGLAYAIYREWEYQAPPSTSAAPPAPPGGPPGSPEFLKFLVQGVEKEIREKYTLPSAAIPELRRRALEENLAASSEPDCRRAVSLLNELLVEGLLIESAMGDGPAAVEELERRFPGLSPGLYRDLIGWLGYRNH